MIESPTATTWEKVMTACIPVKLGLQSQPIRCGNMLKFRTHGPSVQWCIQLSENTNLDHEHAGYMEGVVIEGAFGATDQVVAGPIGRDNVRISIPLSTYNREDRPDAS